MPVRAEKRLDKLAAGKSETQSLEIAVFVSIFRLGVFFRFGFENLIWRFQRRLMSVGDVQRMKGKPFGPGKTLEKLAARKSRI